jgi:lipopolysaccharide heptosyltransferase I
MKSPRILITRLSHIGDCLLTIPMLNAVVEQYPNAFVAWAVESPTHHLLKNHSGIDKIISIPKGWLGKPRTWRAIGAELKSYKFDIAIDPQGLTKSALLGWMSGAPNRVGAKGQWGRELSPWLNNRLVRPSSTHVVERSMELLEEIGIEQSKIRFELPLDAVADKFIDRWLIEKSLNRFAVINPGGSWASKRWENERFGSVASHLFNEHGLKTVVTWAGIEELEMAEEIVALNPEGCVLAGRTNLPELQSLLARADFFVGCDTGPMHLATAVGTPCVGLYGTTRPEDSGAFGPANIAIQKWYQSGSCRKRRNANNDAMRDILASDVNAACDRMLNRLVVSREAA